MICSRRVSIFRRGLLTFPTGCRATSACFSFGDSRRDRLSLVRSRSNRRRMRSLSGTAAVRAKATQRRTICAGCVLAGRLDRLSHARQIWGEKEPSRRHRGRRNRRGISAACSLRHRGVDVTVFEQAKTLGEIGAGVLLLPNGLRQLERMGLGEALAAVGAKIGEGSQYYRADGTAVGPIVTTNSAGWNGLYGMHRADLLNAVAARLPRETVPSWPSLRRNCPDPVLCAIAIRAWRQL